MLLLQTSFLLIYTQMSVSKMYTNYSLYRGIPDSEKKMGFFHQISEILNVDYWRFPSAVHHPVEFTVAPGMRSSLLKIAEKYGVPLTILIEDVQSAFDKQTVRSYKRRNMETFDWDGYYRTDDVYSWMEDLKRAHPDVMQVNSIGVTPQGREIRAARIALEKGVKTRIIIEGGIHAREWVSVSMVTYLLHQVLTSPTSHDKHLKAVARNYEWYFVPILNPDGYEHSHVTDRLQRKNLREVDLNRNFDYQFGNFGASKKKSSETYCGPKPFSEAETEAMRDLINSKRKHLKYYFSFHSYGQYMIIPYGDTEKHLDNFDEVKRMCDRAAKKIAKPHGTRYHVGNAHETVDYKVSGTSTCWVKKTYKVPYVITFELRDEGTHGFALPPELVRPTCEETLRGVLGLLQIGDRPVSYKNRAHAFSVTSVVFFYSICVCLIKKST